MSNSHAIIAACALALPAAAQTEVADRPPVGENPLLTDRSADQLLRERISRPAGARAITPARGPTVDQVQPNQPADATRLDLADGSQAWTEAGTIRPEGTFLVGWTGELVRLRTGGLAFLPVSETGRKPEPAMALAPCGVYARIGNILGDQERGLWLAVTGEVLEYHGRNYLLPTAFTATAAPGAQADAAPAAEAQPGDEPADQPSEQPADQPGGNRIDDLVRQLEAERAERRGIDTAFDIAQDEEGAVDPAAMRLDGRMLLSQRARMVRSAEGGWVIVIDNDQPAREGEPELPPRLRLLPCRVVAQMEKTAEARGEGWSFEVSGQLYRSGPAVYLLPRMFVTMAGTDVKPLQ
ncbi:MAG: hypothetical protein IT431_12990 [Phycisphaerales bacterium]|nr:hypothetical protein [Phycisphaerales bacterium]